AGSFLLVGVVSASSYVTPAEFCNGLPSGQFCNPSFRREVITCPASVSTLCPLQYVCKEGPLSPVNFTASCVVDAARPAVAKCRNAPSDIVTSDCLNDRTIVECPSLMTYSCPPDLVCQRRGRRGYCERPGIINATESELNPCRNMKITNGTQLTCDTVNLRRVVSCPTGESFLCESGKVCAVKSDSTVGCVSFTENMPRFCSNKPLFSSYCVPFDPPSRIILCGTTPTLYQCPVGSPRCYQRLSITATCN
ncbi:hypothetical protein MP638_002651, partial [Amoeboaphelidium occidentale]